MNTIKFMFRARNNLLPFNLKKKLYSINSINSIKLHNSSLFHKFKVRTDRKVSIYLSQVLDYGII